MKKRIGSVLLALALCLSLLPATALAEDTGGTGTSVNVKTVEEFKNALNNNDATKIHITGDIRYSDSLNSSKTIYIDNGATLTLSAPNATVSGTIVNNGTIKVTSKLEDAYGKQQLPAPVSWLAVRIRGIALPPMWIMAVFRILC